MKRGVVAIVLLLVVGYLLAQTKPTGKSQTGASKEVLERGKKVYATYCLSCHQTDGSGVPKLNPPLIKTTWVLGDKKRLINVVLNGMNELIEIDGEEYENVMPAQSFLKDDQIADVLSYVRNSFGNKASVITAAEVKALRGKAKTTK
jgi:mono/diheme cytochrome c family protein